MRVAKLVEPRKIDIVNEDNMKPLGAKQVRVNVKYVGICGTDMHIFQGHRNDIEFPRTMGHEFSGVVSEIGSEVTRVKVGDNVVVDPVFSCDECEICKAGHENVCANVACLGVQVDGAFCDYFDAKENRTYVIPEGVSLEHAATIEPYSIAANVVNRADVQANDKVVIFGAGPIGLVLIQACKSIGAKVLVSDIVDTRLAVAKELGADVVVNSKDQDLKAEVAKFSPIGATVVVDAVGMAPLVETAIDIAAPTGRIMNLGFDSNEAKIKPIDVTKRELSIIGSRMNNNRFPVVLDWFKNKIVDPSKFISKIYPLEQINEAFLDAEQNAQEIIKVLIKL